MLSELIIHKDREVSMLEEHLIGGMCWSVLVLCWIIVKTLWEDHV